MAKVADAVISIEADKEVKKLLNGPKGKDSSEFKLSAGFLIGAIVLASTLLWFNKIDSTQWVDLTKWAGLIITGGFTASRTLVKSKLGK